MSNYGKGELPGTASTLVELLRNRAIDQPEKTAFIFLQDGHIEKDRLTYSVLDQKAMSIAARLQAIGIGTGQRALLLYPPGIDYIAAFMGCLYAGVTAVPVYPPHQARPERTLLRLDNVLKSAMPDISLTIAPILDVMRKKFSKDPYLNKMYWLATDDIEDVHKEWKNTPVSEETIACVQYTSGASGKPKGVMISHGNLLHNEKMLQKSFQLEEQSNIVSWLPLYHDMGLVGNMVLALYAGTPCILLSQIAFLKDPLLWLKAISHYKAEYSGSTNSGYELCIRKIDTNEINIDLSCWKIAFNGFDPVRADTIERFSKKFASCGFSKKSFFPFYGLAEATMTASCGIKNNLPVVCRVQAGAIEKNLIIPTVDSGEKTRIIVGCGNVDCEQNIVIASPDTHKSCKPDTVGEIWISGKNVAKGYCEMPEETKKTFQAFLSDTGEGPFLRTGDLGFIQNNELFVTGKLKDIIVIQERIYYPYAIELIAEQSYSRLRPGCVAAFSTKVNEKNQLIIVAEAELRFKEDADGQPGKSSYSKRRTEVMLPEYTPADQSPLKPDEAFATIRNAIKKEFGLEVFEILLIRLGTIPKTSSGKIKRHACRVGFLKGTLNTVAKSLISSDDSLAF
ncbi:fatty acyl-AMP ligase [Desulfobacterales bacterium HSG16]|nr:fatty acyl-AMP ligase [Desulfobacterales bacterium HSG16]